MQQTLGARVPVGAVVDDTGTHFRIWAPRARTVEVLLELAQGEQAHALEAEQDGWFSAHLAGIRAGQRYRFRLDGSAVYPDPCSRHQPDGVHGPSEVVDPAAFAWTDGDWTGRSLDELVIYELHVGTATPEGTFDALIDRLPCFVQLGVTALEIMPVAEFPGARNWGYDGVFLFAPSRSYGGPDALRRFVDAAHGHGLAVILDVVYNHFGPEGNYMHPVTDGMIFTSRHHTPWGAAVNYDDEGAAAVRAIVLENVRQWVHDYHVDGLRLDATHAIIDASEPHILQEIAAEAHAADRPVSVIAEDERNERRLLLPVAEGGYGLDAVWADDAHHSTRRLVAGDNEGYYAAYAGTAEELARTLHQGWLYQGEHYAPTDEARGTPPFGLPPAAFVHCIQNHDQVGNRAHGERLNHQIDLPVYRAASALLLLSPYTPLLWMGQEWAATTPFLYFTDHPEELGRLVTKGRREEFRGFAQFSDARLRERIPDPQDPETYERSKLHWQERDRQPHAGVLACYRELLAIRRTHPAARERTRDSFDVLALAGGAVVLRRRSAGGPDLLLIANLRGELTTDLMATAATRPAGEDWSIRLWSEEVRFGGHGPPPHLQGTHLVVPSAGALLLEG